MSNASTTAERAMPIGALSKRTGCTVETIRYYERIGLMPPPPRTPSGRRIYDWPHLQRLTFIRRGRDLGFGLEEVRGLLALVDNRRYTCDEVRAITREHLDEVSAKIADLQRLQQVLQDMVDECAGGPIPACPIVDALQRVH